MPSTKVRECTTDECNGVMKLANVADGIPLWECRKCGEEDTRAGTYNKNVYRFERAKPDPDGPYTPFAADDPEPSLSWEAFTREYADDLEQLS